MIHYKLSAIIIILKASEGKNLKLSLKKKIFLKVDKNLSSMVKKSTVKKKLKVASEWWTYELLVHVSKCWKYCIWMVCVPLQYVYVAYVNSITTIRLDTFHFYSEVQGNNNFSWSFRIFSGFLPIFLCLHKYIKFHAKLLQLTGHA